MFGTGGATLFDDAAEPRPKRNKPRRREVGGPVRAIGITYLPVASNGTLVTKASDCVGVGAT